MKGKRNQAKPGSFVLADEGRTYVHLLSALMTDLSTPEEQRNRLLGLARSRSYASLVAEAASIAKQSYGDASSFFRATQLASFISKVPFKDRALNPRAAALDGFRVTERRLARVNKKLRIVDAILRGKRTCKPEHWQSMEWIPRAQRYIARVLGPLDLDEVYRECYFGDGSSNGCSGQATHVINKVRNLTCTPAATPYLQDAFWANAQLRRLIIGDDVGPLTPDYSRKWDEWFKENLATVSCNKVDFVPKKAEIDRAIALEPNGNGFLQLGAAWCIARKLRRVQLNIQDQGVNQLYARFGSECYDYLHAPATIDLKDASNFALMLAKLLLPADWFGFLNAIRSPAYTVDGGPETRYNLFATMGNGFCFPLETLLFWGVCKTACVETGETLLTVYGDDIALPKGAALLAIERLRYMGCRVNTAKTFVHGPFRESCGADFWEGNDVRPFVLDYVPVNSQDLVKIANGLRARGRDFPCTVQQCIDSSPVGTLKLKPHPTGAVDDAILVPVDVFMGANIASKWDSDRQAWNFKVWRSRSEGETPQLNFAEELLAVYHGSTPEKREKRLRGDSGVQMDPSWLGKPVLPLRFTAQTRGRWYLPPVDRPDEGRIEAPAGAA